MAILCLLCNSESIVLESRVLEDFWMRRRRCCVACEYRWTTLEVLIDAVDLIELKQQQQSKELMQREVRRRREEMESLVSNATKGIEHGQFSESNSRLLNIGTSELKMLFSNKKKR